MRTISTGEPSTLATYRKIAVALGGENTKATEFLDSKIAEQGENEEVLADERAMLHVISTLIFGG